MKLATADHSFNSIHATENRWYSKRLVFIQDGLLLLGLIVTSFFLTITNATAGVIIVSPDWNKTTGTTKTHISVQVCVEPPLRRGSTIHDPLFAALRNLKVAYARFQPWRQYPRLAVAELYPPKNGKTSWDLSLIDPIVEDFMAASEGRPVIFTFGTIPSWMLKTERSDPFPRDANEVSLTYGLDPNFTDFDSTIKLFAEYQARLVQWYLKGGFKDEYGKWHASLHHYSNIKYWGILNEPGAEHALTPTQYNRLYDAVVGAVNPIAPKLKFIGLSSDSPHAERELPNEFIEFLNPRNHISRTVLDAMAYHFYATPDWDETAEVLTHSTFKDADRLISFASHVEVLRRYFSPHTKIILEEVGGSFLPWADTSDQIRKQPIDPSYWNLSSAMWAYLYGRLASLGVDMMHGAELIDYPGQTASATLIDWDTGKPNARYWVLKLLRDQFGPGDRIIAPTNSNHAFADLSDYYAVYPSTKVYSQAFISSKGERKVLLVNKRNEPAQLTVQGAGGGMVSVVDKTTTSGAVQTKLPADNIELSALAVAVITFP
jgi:hypothetical protein